MSEDFLSRWARLKHEAGVQRLQCTEVPATDAAFPAVDPVSPPIDVSSLPAIESICAQSTVAPFLQAGVPDDLAQAALRRAWTSDPAIREFVGIAENQWDFNAEGAIAGFGSLSAEEVARHVAARALGAEGAPTERQVVNAAARQASGTLAGLDSTDGPSTFSTSPPPQPSGAVVQQPGGESATAPATPTGVLPGGRTHGSALPR